MISNEWRWDSFEQRQLHTVADALSNALERPPQSSFEYGSSECGGCSGWHHGRPTTAVNTGGLEFIKNNSLRYCSEVGVIAVVCNGLIRTGIKLLL